MEWKLNFTSPQIFPQLLSYESRRGQQSALQVQLEQHCLRICLRACCKCQASSNQASHESSTGALQVQPEGHWLRVSPRACHKCQAFSNHASCKSSTARYKSSWNSIGYESVQGFVARAKLLVIRRVRSPAQARYKCSWNSIGHEFLRGLVASAKLPAASYESRIGALQVE